jgi:hypothetical protein
VALEGVRLQVVCRPAHGSRLSADGTSQVARSR